MFDRLRNRLDAGRQDGFTLIELLIVIVILGVLAGIVVFAVGSARGDSVKAACQADMKTVNTAQEAFKAKTGPGYTDMANLKTAGFIREVPPADYTSSDYKVTWDGTKAVGTLKAGDAAC